MYIKEDLIIPHVSAAILLHCCTRNEGISDEDVSVFLTLLVVFQHHSFYDFIVTKARGKSGEDISAPEKLKGHTFSPWP